MVDYTTPLVLLSMVLYMVTMARSSWISGGGPPPASVGEDYVGDYFADAPSPANNLTVQEKDELAPGPSDDLMTEENDEIAPGPIEDFMIQGKSSIIQEKESVPDNGDTFIIQGKVYCDPCRIQFPTKISYPLPNTKITLVCHKVTGEETYRVEGSSDDKGKYALNAVGDHAEEVCEITVSDSPDPNCPELMDDENHVKVSLTNKHGAKGKGRYANPLGFMTTNADPRCKESLEELGFTGI